MFKANDVPRNSLGATPMMVAGLPFYKHVLPDHVGTATKSLLPVGITENNVRGCADVLALAGRNKRPRAASIAEPRNNFQ